MKTSCLAIVLLVSVTVTQGQVAANPAALPAATPYAVVSLAANSRVWEQTTYEQGPNGTVIPQKNQYTELASGLNYWDATSQQWLESREEIDAYAGGAIAQYGQHKVIFANNLNSAGAIDLQTPDGKELKSHILGLSYYDTASGKSVLIAQTKDCQGQIIGSNQVVYADAFDGVSADVSYTYRRGSFEQDVVLQAAPPSPQTFGLNPATTALQVLTEFDAAPPPNVVTKPVNSGTSTTLPDENLNFGAMRMGLGRAFMLGQNPLDGVNVAKQWLNVNGRTILTESVNLPAIASQLNQLPSAQPATAGTAQRTVPAISSVERVSSRAGTKNSILNVVSKQRLLPSPKLAAAIRKKMKLASVSPASQGLVLDYVEIDTGTDAGDYTFQSDTTYYVTGNFYVDGTIYLEGGAVIKYATNVYGDGIVAEGGVNCETSLYRPVIITSKNDNSVGETISGSTGTPSTYNCAALTFDVGSSLLMPLEFLHIRYASVGLIYCNGTTPLRHSQFVNVNNPFQTQGSPLTVENDLFDGISGTVFSSEGPYYAAQLTVHNAGLLLASSGTTLSATNCLFAQVTNFGGAFTAYDCVTNSSPFVTVGAGSHYVTNDALYRIGNANLNPDLLADLQKMTTYPPTNPPSGMILSSTQTWNQTAARETGSPLMVGYHYPALDYLVSGVNVQNTTLTLGQSVAVGVYGSVGLQTYSAGALISQGTALTHNQLCFYPAVQEQPTALGGGNLMIWDGGDPPSSLKAQFTDFDGMGGMLSLAQGYSFQIQLRDCWVGPGNLSPNSPPGCCYVDGITNNLFERATLDVGTFDYMCPVYFYNNTVRYGTVQIDAMWALNGYRTVRDNLFDNSTLTVAYPNYVAYSNNAYFASSTSLTPYHTGDFTLTELTYADGPLGNRYIDINNTSPSLVDAGSRSVTAAGLWSYSILTNQIPDSGMVDIGYHYPITGNDSTGTDFWMAFPLTGMSPWFLEEFSSLFYISSSLATTGMVTFAGVLVDGPVLTVTNCGDAMVNGTYYLTNISGAELSDGYFGDSVYVKPLSTLQVGFEVDGGWFLFEYDGGTDNYIGLYEKESCNEFNVNGSDWIIDDPSVETNLPPTTFCPLHALTEPFSLAAGQVTNIVVATINSPARPFLTSGIIQTNGIEITASQPVSVYVLDYDETASTAFTGYPTTMLGTNYCVLSRPSHTSVGFSEFAVVATADDTTVTITSTNENLVGFSPPSTNILLQQGETYQISCYYSDGDVTGTFVTADKPIGVFAGDSGAEVPDGGTGAANPLVQEQLPVNVWGTNVVAMPFAGRTGGDLYRVLAYTNTTVWITNSFGVGIVTNLAAGTFCETNLDGWVQFQSTKPIQVAQFANGTDFDHNNEPFEGDPCEILLPPTGHYLTKSIVVAPPNDGVTGDFTTNYLNLIVAQLAANSTWVDSSIVAATNFIAIGNSGYYGAQIPVTNGTHTVTSSQPVGVEVYGWGEADAYSYFGGVVK